MTNNNMKPPKIEIDPIYLDMFKECKPTGATMPKPKENKKGYQITLTPSIKERGALQAEKLNMSLSAYIEELIKEDLSNV